MLWGHAKILQELVEKVEYQPCSLLVPLQFLVEVDPEIPSPGIGIASAPSAVSSVLFSGTGARLL